MFMQSLLRQHKQDQLMTTESRIIQSATFNGKIKMYLLMYIAFILTITIVGIPILIFWFLGFGQYFCRRYYENLKCKLTDRHLEFKKGVFFKEEKTIPLENIQDLTFIENPLLNYFDLRILKIETAGQSNPEGSDMKLIGIINSLNFKEKVLHQRELLKTENRSDNIQTETKNEQIVDLLKEIKGILHDIKNK